MTLLVARNNGQITSRTTISSQNETVDLSTATRQNMDYIGFSDGVPHATENEGSVLMYL